MAMSGISRRGLGEGVGGALLHTRLGRLEERLRQHELGQSPAPIYRVWWEDPRGSGVVSCPATGETVSRAQFEAVYPHALRIRFDLHTPDDWEPPDWAQEDEG
jgi:hypothetical protein